MEFCSRADQTSRRQIVMERDTARLLVWVAAIPAVAVAYYFGVALPSYNEARLGIERQRYAEEQKRSEQKDKEAEEHKGMLETCLQKANDDYFSYLKLNGTQLKNGTLSTPQYVSTGADKRKNDDRDACFKQFGVR